MTIEHSLCFFPLCSLEKQPNIAGVERFSLRMYCYLFFHQFDRSIKITKRVFKSCASKEIKNENMKISN